MGGVDGAEEIDSAVVDQNVRGSEALKFASALRSEKIEMGGRG